MNGGQCPFLRLGICFFLHPNGPPLSETLPPRYSRSAQRRRLRRRAAARLEAAARREAPAPASSASAKKKRGNWKTRKRRNQRRRAAAARKAGPTTAATANRRKGPPSAPSADPVPPPVGPPRQAPKACPVSPPEKPFGESGLVSTARSSSRPPFGCRQLYGALRSLATPRSGNKRHRCHSRPHRSTKWKSYTRHVAPWPQSRAAASLLLYLNERPISSAGYCTRDRYSSRGATCPICTGKDRPIQQGRGEWESNNSLGSTLEG